MKVLLNRPNIEKRQFWMNFHASSTKCFETKIGFVSNLLDLSHTHLLTYSLSLSLIPFHSHTPFHIALSLFPSLTLTHFLTLTLNVSTLNQSHQDFLQNQQKYFCSTLALKTFILGFLTGMPSNWAKNGRFCPIGIREQKIP